MVNLMPQNTRHLLIGCLLIGASALHASEPPHELKFDGMVQLDADWFGEFFDRAAESDDQVELRRGRLGLEYSYDKLWSARVTVQYRERNDDVDLHTAYLRYKGFAFGDIQVGKFKQPFGLERMESASRVSAVERSMASELLTPDRAIGVQISKRKKDYTWALGVFQEDDEDDGYQRTPPQSATARFTYAPLQKKKRTVHFGVAGSYRDWNENLFSARSRAGVNTADNIVRSARFLADRQWLLGLEAAWQRGPLLLQSEYMFSEVDAAGFSQTFSYSGYYVQGSYLLTGERKRYSKGEFRRVKPKNRLGAVELVARHGEIDLRDQGVGAQSSVSMLGINYHWKRNLKVMLNVLRPDIKGDTVHAQTDGDAVTLRLQYRI